MPISIFSSLASLHGNNAASGAISGVAAAAAAGIEQHPANARRLSAESLARLGRRHVHVETVVQRSTSLTSNAADAAGREIPSRPGSPDSAWADSSYEPNFPDDAVQFHAPVHVSRMIHMHLGDEPLAGEMPAQTYARVASHAAVSHWYGSDASSEQAQKSRDFLTTAASSALIERLGSREGFEGKELLDLIAGLVFTDEGLSEAGRQVLLHNATEAMTTLEHSTDENLWAACKAIASEVECGDSTSHRFTQIREAILAFDMRTSGRSLDDVFDGILGQVNQSIVERVASAYAQRIGRPDEAVEYYMSLATRVVKHEEKLLNTAATYLNGHLFKVDVDTVNACLSEIREHARVDNPQLFQRFTQHPAFQHALKSAYSDEYSAVLADRSTRQDVLEKALDACLEPELDANGKPLPTLSSEELRLRSEAIQRLEPDWLAHKATEAFAGQMHRLASSKATEPSVETEETLQQFSFAARLMHLQPESVLEPRLPDAFDSMVGNAVGQNTAGNERANRQLADQAARNAQNVLGLFRG